MPKTQAKWHGTGVACIGVPWHGAGDQRKGYQMTDTKRAAIAADITKMVLTFTAANGEEVRIDADTLTTEVRHTAMMHGLKQKIGDAAAMSRNPETGASATLADKVAAMRAVSDRLQAGQWNAERGTGGEGGLLVRALMQLSPDKTRAEVEATIEKWTTAEQAAVRKNPKVAAIIAAIQAEKAKASGIDSDALLGGLMGGE